MTFSPSLQSHPLPGRRGADLRHGAPGLPALAVQPMPRGPSRVHHGAAVSVARSKRGAVSLLDCKHREGDTHSHARVSPSGGGSGTRDGGQSLPGSRVPSMTVRCSRLCPERPLPAGQTCSLLVRELRGRTAGPCDTGHIEFPILALGVISLSLALRVPAPLAPRGGGRQEPHLANGPRWGPLAAQG